MQDPKFYDAYKKALDESDMRTEAVLNTIQAVFENLFSIFGIQTVWQSTARMRIEKMAGISGSVDTNIGYGEKLVFL